MVLQVGIEPTPPLFQSGAQTLYATGALAPLPGR